MIDRGAWGGLQPWQPTGTPGSPSCHYMLMSVAFLSRCRAVAGCASTQLPMLLQGYLTERQQALLDGKILFNATPTHEVVTIRNPAMEASDDAAKTMQEETAI